jgi:hypothetical protein
VKSLRAQRQYRGIKRAVDSLILSFEDGQGSREVRRVIRKKCTEDDKLT